MNDSDKSMYYIIADPQYLINMSSRPEFYSGRGPYEPDCSAKHLRCLTYAVYDNFGTAAANAFVAMIIGLHDLSATNVLASLYKLEREGWQNPDVRTDIADHFGEALSNHNDNPEALAGSAMGCLLSMHRDSSNDAQRSEGIKKAFLQDITWKALTFEIVRTGTGRRWTRCSDDAPIDAIKTQAAFLQAAQRGAGHDYTKLAPIAGQRPCW